jgi:alkanesulfonate monooxygenase SsuD/methylene tetrahydromethanopterin reductase-like flavin-dependent oxidoreductase (luciferase family)
MRPTNAGLVLITPRNTLEAMPLSSTAPPRFGWVLETQWSKAGASSASADVSLEAALLETNHQHIDLLEAAGFDAVWVEDHLDSAHRSQFECFTTLAWYAGRHPRMRYGTMVCAQAFRNPALLANMAANMHRLTNSRFVLGVGAGNNAREHNEYGYGFLDPPRRLAQTEEALKIIRALWHGDHVMFQGGYYTVGGASLSPLTPTPPVLMVGGRGPRMLGLVARYADWWCADVGPLDMFLDQTRRLNVHCYALGRDPRTLACSKVVWVDFADDFPPAGRILDSRAIRGDAEQVLHSLEEFRNAGVGYFHLRFMDYPSTRGLERFLDRVLPRLQA